MLPPQRSCRILTAGGGPDRWGEPRRADKLCACGQEQLKVFRLDTAYTKPRRHRQGKLVLRRVLSVGGAYRLAQKRSLGLGGGGLSWASSLGYGSGGERGPKPMQGWGRHRSSFFLYTPCQ
jgi:hypothetical protein